MRHLVTKHEHDHGGEGHTIQAVRQQVEVKHLAMCRGRLACGWVDLCAGLSNLGHTILQTLFVETQLFTLASQQVFVQADQLQVALQQAVSHQLCTYNTQHCLVTF